MLITIHALKRAALLFATAAIIPAVMACGLLGSDPAPTQTPMQFPTQLSPTEPPPTDPPTPTPEPAPPTQAPTEPPPVTKETPPPAPRDDGPIIINPNITSNNAGARKNICQRTPEIQTAIIAALAEVGPELPCSLINPDEMLRLRNLEIRSTDIEPDDLANLPNLHELTLATRVNRLRDLTPDTFSGMTKLKSLTLELSHPTVKIRTAKTEEFSSNLFRNTPTLAHLRILTDENSPSILLTKEPFRGISPLTTLHVDHIHAIDPDALELLPALRALTIIGEHALEATKQQTLPPDIFKNQLLLQRAQVQGLEFPSAITLASFEAACYAQQWIPKDDNDEPTIQIFVDRQKVDLIKPGPEDKQEGCLLRVGDNRLIEVLN